jgi:hypothetical protein
MTDKEKKLIKDKKLIEEMDELACASCCPETFPHWCALVRYWDEYFPQFKGIKKDYHEE